MLTTIAWFWIAFAVLIVLAGLHRLFTRWSRRSDEEVRVDDEAVRRILQHGTLRLADDEPLDAEEIARAEEEFWEQSWDEPEEFGR